MFNPNDPNLMVQALRGLPAPSPELQVDPNGNPMNGAVPQQMAGDVLRLPIAPNGSTGPTPYSAPYAHGLQADPKVLPIGEDIMRQWFDNTLRKRFLSDVQK